MKPRRLAVMLLLIGCVQVWGTQENHTEASAEYAVESEEEYEDESSEEGGEGGEEGSTEAEDDDEGEEDISEDDSDPLPLRCRKPTDEEVLDTIREPPLPDGSPCLPSVGDLAKQVNIPASCCPDPTWSCQSSGGNCRPSWLVENNIIDCDVLTGDQCDNYPHCQCCVDCGSNLCSPCNQDQYTSCRANCTTTQFAVNKPCHSDHCQCCKECQVEPECSDVGGHCVGDPSYCTDEGFFPSTWGCKGDGCHCCRPAGPCMPLPECESGRCSTTPCDEDEIQLDTGCLGPNCHCCYFRDVFEGDL